MSEFINNVTRRKEIIKNVLKGLHEGKPVEEVTTEFATLAGEATSSEIAEVEQMLIAEGLPAAEVQRLCDVHVRVFKQSLEKQTPPESQPGHPVHTFRLENEIVLGLLSDMRKTLGSFSASEADGLEELRQQFNRLKMYERHYQRKEYLLFPNLERHAFSGPSTVMWGIHDEIRKMWKIFGETLASASPAAEVVLLEQFKKFEQPIREMVYKEEKILFPAAMEHLSEEEWLGVRKGEAEYGYFLVQPGSEWHPVISSAAPAAEPEAVMTTDVFPLDTGVLTLEQVNLLLKNLPVDVTLVDEKDEVRFFSQTKERIFARPPSIIGRQVINCHPPQSYDRVRQILDDFRSGTRDVAEFWIPMGEKFIHIRYFALRGAAGEYKGCIEVSQDVAGIRALQGEKRLL
jgi:DUF438 domain-containing protein